ELLDLVELEVRELLSSYEFPGDQIPVIRGAALKAIEGDAKYVGQVWELLKALDAYVPVPKREVDKPFLMPVEDVFSITGRGTVATGRIERGKVKGGGGGGAEGAGGVGGGGEGGGGQGVFGGGGGRFGGRGGGGGGGGGEGGGEGEGGGGSGDGGVWDGQEGGGDGGGDVSE